jgi:hypothetical protein
LKYAAIAGESFAGSRLSAMIGTSSAAEGVGFKDPGFAPAFGGAALPPLMARSTGWSFLGFADAVLAAGFADLLVLGISTSPTFVAVPVSAYNVIRTGDTSARSGFYLLFQPVNGPKKFSGNPALCVVAQNAVLLSTHLRRV